MKTDKMHKGGEEGLTFHLAAGEILAFDCCWEKSRFSSLEWPLVY